MSLSVIINTDSIDVTNGDDESIVTLQKDDRGIVVHSKEKFVDSSTGESVRRYCPVAFISYERRKFQKTEKFYEAIEQEITPYLRENSSTTLHDVWSTAREARRQLKEQENVPEGDVA